MKMPNWYREFHYKDKTVSRPAYIYNGDSPIERMSLYWKWTLMGFKTQMNFGYGMNDIVSEWYLL